MIAAASILDWLARAGTVIAIVSWVTVFTRRRVRRHRVQSFFGGDSVDVVLPLRTLDGRTAVSEPDFMTGLALQRFLTRFGIEIRFGFIRPDEALRLTAPGTVVICGPKSSDAVSRAMRRDPVLLFSEDARGWSLTGDGRRYRSKSDAVPEGPADETGDLANSDIGYLSRTIEDQTDEPPRIVVWIAGVHAPGSAIVADRLCRTRSLRIARKLAPSGRFSAVIGGTYTEHPLEVTASQRLFFAEHPTER